MKHHVLKCWPESFAPLLSGEKTFELRLNDRDYVVGDTLLLKEWEPKTEAYSGRWLRKRVTYILHGPGIGAAAPFKGLSIRYVIMALVDEVMEPC